MMLQLGVFVAVTVSSLILLWLGSGRLAPARARFRRRLDEEFAPGGPDGPGPLYKNLDTLDSSLASDRPPGPTGARTRPRAGWRPRAEEVLRQAGLQMTPHQFLGWAGGLAAAGGVLGAVFVGPAAAAAGLAAGLAGPFVALNVQRKRRREKYLRQLVGAFELMARVLRAGQAVPEAFRAAVSAFDDPLAEEFSRCVHQTEHGLRPDAAFRELSDRSGVLELRLFVVAMTIQRQTGGNLSEVLDRLAAVARARLRVRQKVRALTAEGRLQSVTLTAMPVLVFGMMYLLNRQYAEALLAQWRLMAGTVACVTVGTLWIRSIMNFEG